ncbi:hypothetical protein [Microbacterium sp. NPDC058345]|uniref:hypothetical protein n=1 Tax=Microbacterium sp. NPDC058345 TaxID=3346455 RepID=UPI0036484BB5
MTQERKVGWRVSAMMGLIALLTFGGPASSWGYWRTEASVENVAVDAATVAPVSDVRCFSKTEGLLNLVNYVRIEWRGSGDASSYSIYVSDPKAPDKRYLLKDKITQTSVEVREGDIVGELLGNVLAILFGSSSAKIEIVAVHSSGWDSKPAFSDKNIRPTGLTSLLLGGLKCA